MVRQTLLKYWNNPPPEDNNCPMDYYGPSGWFRSAHLSFYLANIPDLLKEAKILEIGSGVGRNLAVLKFAGYENLTGVELSQASIDTMRDLMPILNFTPVHQGPAEEVLYSMAPDSFDLVFTMAVLEHLPPESEHVFEQIVKITKTYLLTIEDEVCVSSRHFPRNYKRVFEPLGLKEIDVEKKLPHLSFGFQLRLFTKEGE